MHILVSVTLGGQLDGFTTIHSFNTSTRPQSEEPSQFFWLAEWFS
eukprot:COSAG01_NODE_59359_length_293_cov_2.149254_1_plen_44_part_01